MDNTTRQFFEVLPVAPALERLFEVLPAPTRTETRPTAQAVGRVLAVAPVSPISLPEFPRSSMDGYAVRAEDTFGASETLPAYLEVVGTVAMGTVPTQPVGRGQAMVIHTGAMLPPGTDAVVMIERTQALDERQIEALTAVAPGENVVQVGEDVTADAEILPAGHRLRPQDIGGLLAVGITTVTVYAAPRVAILGSGDELVAPEQTPQLGQIRDINSATLAALFTQAGATASTLGIARDRYDDLLALAKQGYAQSDLLVLSAGSSLSTRDLTREVIDALGAPGVIQHGLAVKPGKPTILAVCDGVPVIGLPGNPVSALLVARQVCLPIIRYLSGEGERRSPGVPAVLTHNIASRSGREDTVPVRLIATAGGWQAEPIFGKSNLIFTLLNADGLVTVPLDSGGLKAGETVEVVLL